MRRAKSRSRLIGLVLAVSTALLGACASDGSEETDSANATGESTTEADLNGTYRYELTQEDADAAGIPPGGSEYPVTNTVTLKDGELEGGCFGSAGGTYEVEGDEITFHSNEYDADTSVTFSMDDEGTLDLEPAGPMDPGVAFECFYKPWTKIAD